MKKLLVLGATGGTGRLVLRRVLDNGYDVTILTRNPDSLPLGVVGMRVLTGDVLDAAALASAVAGQDAVVSTLGVGKSFKSGGLIATSTAMIVRAMEAAGVRRIVMLSGYGVGDTFRDAPLIPRIFMRTLLRNVYADKRAGENHLRRSALDWTIVYATSLTDKPRTGQRRVGERLALRGLPTITRADAAEFLVEQIDDRTFVRRGVLVSS